MSSPVSPLNAAQAAITTLDIEQLINEVQKRPPIWDKTCREYSDRIKKTRMWEEVFNNVVEDYSELNLSDKKVIGTEIQKKWRNLKDAFAKELAAQKKVTSGQAAKKKRPYVHFEALSFLASQPLQRSTTSNISGSGDESDGNDSVASTIEKRNRKYARKKNPNTDNMNDTDSQILEILREKKSFDEDISFCEMLIPMVKKLNDDQKHFAKVEILNILDKAKRYSPPTAKSRFEMSSSFQAPKVNYRQVRPASYELCSSRSSSAPSPSYVVSPIPSPGGNHSSDTNMSIQQNPVNVHQYATPPSPDIQIRGDNNMLMQVPLNPVNTQPSDVIQHQGPSTLQYTTLQNYDTNMSIQQNPVNVHQYATPPSPDIQIRGDNNMLMQVTLNPVNTQPSDVIQHQGPSKLQYTTLQNYEPDSSRENNQIQPEKRINITDYLVFKR